MRKNRTFWGVVGSLLILFGSIYTIPLALRGGGYLYWLAFTGAAVVIGVLLIAWAYGE